MLIAVLFWVNVAFMILNVSVFITFGGGWFNAAVGCLNAAVAYMLWREM